MHRPRDHSTHPWIIDGTLDHTISAASKNYRRSVHTQIIIRSHRPACW